MEKQLKDIRRAASSEKNINVIDQMLDNGGTLLGFAKNQLEKKWKGGWQPAKMSRSIYKVDLLNSKYNFI